MGQAAHRGEVTMPRTRQDPWVYYWTNGEVYGPDRCGWKGEALSVWAYESAMATTWLEDHEDEARPDDLPYGLCILDEANHIAYIRPGHPNSIANPEKMTKRMLEASGRTREAKWEIKEMEEA